MSIYYYSVNCIIDNKLLGYFIIIIWSDIRCAVNAIQKLKPIWPRLAQICLIPAVVIITLQDEVVARKIAEYCRLVRTDY